MSHSFFSQGVPQHLRRALVWVARLHANLEEDEPRHAPADQAARYANGVHRLTSDDPSDAAKCTGDKIFEPNTKGEAVRGRVARGRGRRRRLAKRASHARRTIRAC